jgi:predicted nuclease with TOPRIM domain
MNKIHLSMSLRKANEKLGEQKLEIAELKKENASLDYQNKRVCTEVAELEAKLTCNFTNYETMPAESVAGIALRQLGDVNKWVDIAWLNSLNFPDVGPNDYYPVGTVLIMPERA